MSASTLAKFISISLLAPAPVRESLIPLGQAEFTDLKGKPYSHIFGNWKSVDDRIMGGFSESGVRVTLPWDSGESTTFGLENPIQENYYPRLYFAGEVKRGGGFASVRSSDRPHRDAVEEANKRELNAIQVELDKNLTVDKTFSIQLRTPHTESSGVYYIHDFTVPSENDSNSVCMYLKDFLPKRKGSLVNDHDRLSDFRSITSIGLMISHMQFGEFSLGIRDIRATSK